MVPDYFRRQFSGNSYDLRWQLGKMGKSFTTLFRQTETGSTETEREKKKLN